MPFCVVICYVIFVLFVLWCVMLFVFMLSSVVMRFWVNVRLCCVVLFCAMVCHVMSCCFLLCCMMSCHVVSFCVTIFYVVSRYARAL